MQGKPGPVAGTRRRDLSKTPPPEDPMETNSTSAPRRFLSFINGEFTESRP